MPDKNQIRHLRVRTTRRKFLCASATLGVVGALAIAAESAIVEPNHPKLVRIEVPLARLPESWDGIRIAQISDFHYDEHFSVVPIRKAIDIVNRLDADLVVLTGDFVTTPLFKKYLGGSKRAARFIEPCANLLAQVRARRGVLAILGNHDAGSDPHRITEALQAKGITVLRNRSIPFEQGGKRLWLAGLDDVLERQSDLELTLRPVPKNRASGSARSRTGLCQCGFALSSGSSIVRALTWRAGSVSYSRCSLFAAIRKEISQRIAPNPWLNSLHEYWDWYHSSARALLLST
jgi:predicted phosphodiesterase